MWLVEIDANNPRRVERENDVANLDREIVISNIYTTQKL